MNFLSDIHEAIEFRLVTLFKALATVSINLFVLVLYTVIYRKPVLWSSTGGGQVDWRGNDVLYMMMN